MQKSLKHIGRLLIKTKRGKWGLILFSFFFFFSMSSELWSNSKPLVLITQTASPEESAFFTKYRFYFPVFFDYSVEEFHIEDDLFIDYKKLFGETPTFSHNFFALFPLNPWDADEQCDDTKAPPSATHWLGTDELGRDIVARLLYGIRSSLAFALLFWLLSYTIGTVIGALQGYFVGTLDFLVERTKELAETIPMLTLIILVTGLMQDQSFLLTLVLALFFGWIGISNQIRTQFLSLRQQEFCAASLALGASNLRVLGKHLLPNALTPLLTLSPFALEAGISLIATLDYLGFGLPPPTPSLGELLAQGKENVLIAPWLLITPIAALLLLLVSISLIGQALRDILDPKTL